MITVALLLAPMETPDAAPAMAALRACDRAAVARITKAEPRRRTDFAAAAYAEQRGIASERAAMFAPAPDPAAASPAIALVTYAATLDARQKQLDDARAVEASWRDLVDALKADFLVNCPGGRP